MRILFTFAGGSGHFEPLRPIARAAAAAGHTIAFAAQPALVPVVKAAGFATFSTAGSTFSSEPQRLPLLPVDLEREQRALREGFARRLARQRADALLATCEEWRPDLLVCDETDFGAMVAAERLGLPYASVLVIAAGSFVRKEVVGEALAELRAAHGLPPDPELTMLSRYQVLSPFPPSYRDPAFPLPATAYSIRPLTPTPAPAQPALPRPLALPDAPTIYFTLGTVFNVESGDLFERVLAGLATLPINAIVTVGRELDPAIFEPQPPNIQILRYIPLETTLPHCAAVISHGGSGSVIGALAHGLPMVLLPMGADQPQNAGRCAELGVAQVLDVVVATPDDVREALMRVLDDPSYRQRAERLRDEISSLPPPEQAVPLLERLVLKGPARRDLAQS